MDRLDFQKLRELPIEAVAERLGLRVARHKSLCPFHDDHHASLTFSQRRNGYRCFACGASGGTIDLVMHHLHLDFLAACRWLADEHNIILTDLKDLKDFKDSKDHKERPFDASRYERYFEHPWLNDEARRFLFEERRLDERVVRWCRLTSWQDRQGIPWLQIPYYNKEGRLVGVQNRNLLASGKYSPPSRGGAGGEAPPRFRFPQGSQCGIYNMPVLNLLKPGDELWITEGCSDCWAMLSAGHKAVAIPSATLLSRKDAELLSTLNSQLSTQFHMFPDRDAPGERLFLQLREILPTLRHHQLPPDCKDFSDYYLATRAQPP